MLRSLARRVDLSDPEAIKAAIADLDVSEGRKENLVCVYSGFCRQYGIAFEAPSDIFHERGLQLFLLVTPG
jgi:hypothetical protein